MGTFINKIKKLKLYIFLATLVLVAIFVGQKVLRGSQPKQANPQNILAAVKKGTVTSSISASGKVETANYLAITTSVNGIVKEVFVEEEDVVTKGQKIMEITLNSDGEESRIQAWSSYLSAKVSLEKSKTDLMAKESSLVNAEEAFEKEKVANSYQTHSERISYKVAENSYNIAKDGCEQQLNAISQAEVSLNKAWLSYQAQSPTIVAPDSGTIANILVIEGMDIANSLSERTSASVASIKKEGNPIISLSVSELDINNVKVGQKVTMELNSAPEKRFTGKVAGIDKIGAVSGGITNYTVIVKFEENSELALPNMGVESEIIVDEKKDVLLVPSTAITSGRNQAFVTVMDNDTEKKIRVELGISDGTNTEIISGLNEGDQVVVTALPTSGFREAQEQNQGQRGGFGGPEMFIR